MSTQTKPRHSDQWINLPDPAEEPEAGYAEHVSEAIAEGLADLEAGRVTPADQVWKELGIE